MSKIRKMKKWLERLRHYGRLRKQAELIKLFGTVEYDGDYDDKVGHSRS